MAIAVALLAVSLLAVSDDCSDAASGDWVLFDYGNGVTVWTPVCNGDTVAKAAENSASGANITFAVDGSAITVDGIGAKSIGGSSAGGSFVNPGTTGVKIKVAWHIYKWTEGGWTKANLSEPYVSGSLAVGYYPDGTVPLETPQHRSSWAMVRGDSAQSADQYTETVSKDKAKVEWSDTRGGISGVYSSALSANGRVFVKFGTSTGMSTEMVDAALRCYSESGKVLWTFEFPGILYYETATPLIVGDYIYTSSGLGFIFKLPWRTGPGEGNKDVTTFDGKKYVREDVLIKKGGVPYVTGAELIGSTYSTGCNSPVFDSGAIYCTASNGMVYCFDLDLKLVWSHQLGGSVYFTSPTIVDGNVFAGALNGTVYVLKASDGSLVASEKVYTKISHGKEYGSVSGIVCMKRGTSYALLFPVGDGRGMNSIVGGFGAYRFDGSALHKVAVVTEGVGLMSNYMAYPKNGNGEFAYAITSDGFYKISSDGVYTLINGKLSEIHAGPVIVNSERIQLASYTAGACNYVLDMNGNVITEIKPPMEIRNFNMSPMITVGDRTYVGNDAGVYCIYGEFRKEAPPAEGGMSPAVIAIIIILLLLVIAAVLIFARSKNKASLLHQIRSKSSQSGEGVSQSRVKRKRLALTLVFGAVIAVIMFTLCLAVGSTATFSVPETYSLLFSAVSKGGVGLTENEILIYHSRLPRTLVAMAVGVGLSIAGAVYQAIIRNPLVDPYIMGVSSGAGTAAVAVIAFNFTFFGLFPAHSLYLTAFAAIVGGVVAFFSTMLIAERAGSSSSNYVLAGVVVGLAFSAVQTLMLTMAGQRVSSALSWLFGSFANVSWSHVWIVLIPVLAISLSILIWAKELNLVLIGEDQAKQMGLDVRKFNRWMLILASVLTSICVAFCGIIGFVGLVVPHLCRMVLGGDHRLVLPSAMVLGCSLMMGADFISRALIPGLELPVGAITTVIGVPVFAYLLVKRGRMYDG